jgi:hypothetical protein
LKRFDLLRETRGFAETLGSVLNSTVARGVSLSCVGTNNDEVLIGCGIRRRDVIPKPFKLNRGPSGQQVWMLVSFRLGPDDARCYLQVNSSVIALTAGADGASELMHFDYERDKPDEYPEAHLQIAASSEAWASLSPQKSLSKFHFPVGGRRFRFTLEDVAEFLIREGLVEPSPGATSTLKEHRAEFQRQQLRAAIRRDPDTARQYLSELDAAAP